jgi:putative phosphoribosyl transferase
MTQEADEVVCLEAPEEFYAVGQFFEDFSQVTDAEVVAILQQTSGATASAQGRQALPSPVPAPAS